MRRRTQCLDRLSAGLGLAAITIIAYGCADDDGPTPPSWEGPLPTAEAVVVQYEADDQLIFLEPLAEGTPTAPLASGLVLEVTVCDVTPGSEECLPVEIAEEQDGHYGARWSTEKQAAGHEYSIVVRLNDIRIGELLVTLEQGGGENAGRTFPIKFWVGEGLGGVTAPAVVACLDEDRCHAVVAPSDETTEIVTEDENGNEMAILTLPAGAAPSDLVVTVDCRAGGFAPGDGPLPTALNQWPLFCAVEATLLDGTDFTGILNFDATMEVCVVDDDDQPQYHAFVHDDLRLGKSDGPGDFQILPTAASTSLASCDGLQTTAAQGPGAGLLDAVGSRFAALLSPILPRKLHATVFSDGGVTGLLRSFSDINPVEPAFVSGSVTGSSVGIGGVTLQISGGSLVAPYPTATTDAQGGYSFSEALNAAGNGTVYTVEVTGGVPAGIFLDTDQDVTVTGSGTVQVDFVAVGVLFDGGTVAGGSGTVFDWAVGANSGTGPAPFRTLGLSTSCSDLQGFASTVGTDDVWPLGSNANPTVITLTKQFYVPAGTDALQLTGWVDNDARVTLYDADQAGTDITGTPVDNDGWRSHENCANVNPLIFFAPSGSFTAGAVNTLVIEVRDRGDIGYADFELEVLTPS